MLSRLIGRVRLLSLIKKKIEKNTHKTQYILGCQKSHPTASGNLTLLLMAIQTACKFIAAKVRTAGNTRACAHDNERRLLMSLATRAVLRSGLGHLYGEEGTTNVQGEAVKKLDVISNEAFCSALRRSLVCSAMISEEDEKVILIPEATGSILLACCCYCSAASHDA